MIEDTYTLHRIFNSRMFLRGVCKPLVDDDSYECARHEWTRNGPMELYTIAFSELVQQT